MALPGDAAGMSRSWNNDQPIGLAGIGLLMQQVARAPRHCSAACQGTLPRCRAASRCAPRPPRSQPGVGQGKVGLLVPYLWILWAVRWPWHGAGGARGGLRHPGRETSAREPQGRCPGCRGVQPCLLHATWLGLCCAAPPRLRTSSRTRECRRFAPQGEGSAPGSLCGSPCTVCRCGSDFVAAYSGGQRACPRGRAAMPP